MFKLTCFAPIEPINLANILKGVHFKPIKNGLEWHMDGAVFRIEPFQNQPRESMKAYRVYFNGDIHGGAYLFDLSLGCLGALVTGVEYLMDDPTMENKDWISDIRKRRSYKVIDTRGIFEKQGVGIVVVNNTVTLQMRSRKNKKLIMVDALKQVNFIREELFPIKYDLFSHLEEDIA